MKSIFHLLTDIIDICSLKSRNYIHRYILKIHFYTYMSGNKRIFVAALQRKSPENTTSIHCQDSYILRTMKMNDL